MSELLELPRSVNKILVTRLDGLGDIVLGTMLLSALHAKWPHAQVLLVVRQQNEAVRNILPDWVAVHCLPFDPRESPIGHESEIVTQLRDFAGQIQVDLAVVGEYNRTWASEIIAELCGAQTVVAFDGPRGLNHHHRSIAKELNAWNLERWKLVAADAHLREPAKYLALLTALGLDATQFAPSLCLRDEDRAAAGLLWEQTGVSAADTLVIFPSSGDHFARSLDATVWQRWITRLANDRPIVLLGSDLDQPVLESIASHGLPETVTHVIISPARLGVTAAFIEQAGTYIGMDTGPMHIAATLGRRTLGIFGGGYRAERFLPVGKNAAAVRMSLSCYGCEWLCPFERRLCIKDIPEAQLFDVGAIFLDDAAENADVYSTKIFDLPAARHLPNIILGPIMRQHRQFLDLHHQRDEHHAYVQSRLDDLAAHVASLSKQNHERNVGTAQLSDAIAEMSVHNRQRDEAITHLSQALAEMTVANQARDDAGNQRSSVLAEMSRQNDARDAAINHLNATIAEMSRHNVSRDQAIAIIGERTEGLKVKKRNS